MQLLEFVDSHFLDTWVKTIDSWYFFRNLVKVEKFDMDIAKVIYNLNSWSIKNIVYDKYIAKVT